MAEHLEITPYLENLLASFFPDHVVFADSDPWSPEYENLQLLFKAGLIEVSDGGSWLRLSDMGRQRLKSD